MGKTEATNLLRLITFGLVIILFCLLDNFFRFVSGKLIIRQNILYLFIVLAHIQIFDKVLFANFECKRTKILPACICMATFMRLSHDLLGKS